jgi:hypothetical protein
MRMNISERHKMILIFSLAALLLIASSPAHAYNRFIADTETGIISDQETDLEWITAPDIEIDWFEAFVWLEELGEPWRCPSIEELTDLHEAGITMENPGPFDFTGNWIWCGDLSNYDSVYCFDFNSGYMCNRIAEWNAFEYISGFRAFAVRSCIME